MVLNSRAWSALFSTDLRDNNPIYKELEYIQTACRHKPGRGITHEIKFLAPLIDTNAESAKQEIFYNYKDMPDDLQLLEAKRYEDYCRKQCLKICYYVKQTKKLEILQMHAEFLQDDCDNIWFTYARSIHFRRMARN
jgi:hypothetical protein